MSVCHIIIHSHTIRQLSLSNTIIQVHSPDCSITTQPQERNHAITSCTITQMYCGTAHTKRFKNYQSHNSTIYRVAQLQKQKTRAKMKQMQRQWDMNVQNNIARNWETRLWVFGSGGKSPCIKSKTTVEGMNCSIMQTCECSFENVQSVRREHLSVHNFEVFKLEQKAPNYVASKLILVPIDSYIP